MQEEELRKSHEHKYQHLNDDLHVEITGNQSYSQTISPLCDKSQFKKMVYMEFLAMKKNVGNSAL